MLEISLLPRINPYAVGERGVVSGESDLSDADLGYEICHISSTNLHLCAAPFSKRMPQAATLSDSPLQSSLGWRKTYWTY